MKWLNLFIGVCNCLSQFDRLHKVPHGWTQRHRAPPTMGVQFRLAMKQQAHDVFEQTLFAISNPDHELYGQYLQVADIKNLTKSSETATKFVYLWLQQSGINDSQILYDGSNTFHFETTIKVAEAMMGSEFYSFEDASGMSITRTLGYSVPDGVASHLMMIHPTTHFGQMSPQRISLSSVSKPSRQAPSATTINSGNPAFNITLCNQTITPDCLRAIYEIGNFEAKSSSGSLLGISGYLNQFPKYDAYARFLSEYAPYAKDQNFTYLLVNGGRDIQNDTTYNDFEGNLDVMYTAPLVMDTKINYYSTGGLGYLVPDLDQPLQENNENEPYLQLIDYLLSLPDSELPQTLTTSYGEGEQTVPEGYARTVCDMFGQLGLRGVSVIFSSGDTGPGSACQTNDGKNKTRFIPQFPAACPYVTSVGATRHFEPESSVFYSSGGFSEIFPRPVWQHDAVEKYLKILGTRWKGLYNPRGRAFPDVSAQGWAFEYIEKNHETQELESILGYGTSAAAPTFASIIHLINSERLLAKQPPLGFLNPWLYSRGRAGLKDVVNGGSTGCTGESIYSGLPTPVVPYASWNATVGWDPVSGLGTPNFPKLLALSRIHKHV